MNKIQTLYHGTTKLFDCIDLSKGEGYKDFGPGFYASGNKQRAIKLARSYKRSIVEMNKISIIKDVAIAYCYELGFDTSAYSDTSLRILVFNKADINWAKFILINRMNKYKIHNYDIVVGPTADNYTNTIINKYIRRYSGDIDSGLNQLLVDLKPDIYPKQYYFGTTRSLNYLKLYRNRRFIV